MKIQKLSSSYLKQISKLKLKKYREETNSFLIESEKILKEALKSDWKVEEIYLTSRNLHLIDSLMDFSSLEYCKIFELSEKEFNKISNETTPSGIAAKIQKKKFNLNSIFENHTQIILAFEKISDPGNLGTILRTADWFGFKSIVLSENSVDFTNPKVIKASMGSIFHLEIFEETNLKIFFELVKEKNYKVLGTSSTGKNIASFQFSQKYVIVFGNESKGLSKDVFSQCDDIIGIPAFGSAESLNLAISSSIILYELRRKDFLNHI